MPHCGVWRAGREGYIRSGGLGDPGRRAARTPHMEKALIIGESGAIGRAVATELRGRGWSVEGLSRSGDGFDITDAASVERHLGQARRDIDLVLIATGALEIDGNAPEKSLRDLTVEAMAAQYLLNAIGPALVMRHTATLLARDRRAVVATLSARIGSIGDNRLGGWVSYRAAKAGLNQIIRSAAIELGRSHAQAICVALHPGTVESALTRRYLGRHPAVTPKAAAHHLLAVLDGLSVAHSGGFFDWRGDPVAW